MGLRSLSPLALAVTILSLIAFVAPSSAHAAPLLIDGGVAGPVACPDGGVAVDASCNVNATPALNNACRYGGEHTFDSITLQNDAVLCVVTFNGTDLVNTGDAILKTAGSISVDATSRITAKGQGYRPVVCGDGNGPTATAGGRGGCSVQDSGGGGAHFGAGGRGTKDCFIVLPADSCQFPEEWEEDCGDLAPGGGSCVDTIDPNKPVCYGATNNANGEGDALPSVAGQPYQHDILVPQLGASGGDKGCRDGFDAAGRAGAGGGRIVLFAANAAKTGSVFIAGRITADGDRGCSSGNDSAGGGGGGTILVVGDQVQVTATARVSAHGGRGGDSQPKCISCTSNAECQVGQTCTGGRCGPCNCTPCSTNAQCDALLGQTCKNLGGDLGSVCANNLNQCTPFDPGANEDECRGTQNNGTCDDCAGGGGGGIINIQSRDADIHPQAIFDVRGAAGGICPICAGEAGGGAGELQIDGGYVGEVCDGYDNDFNGTVDDGLGMIGCPDGTMILACVGGLPQQCAFDIATCAVQASDARPRFALIVDTSGSMLNDLSGYPTFGDGSVAYPGVDTASDADAIAGNNSRLFIAKDALTEVLSAFPESDYALARYYQDVGVNRSCQSASNFECAGSCCSYDDPSDNVTPTYPDTYPGNECILSNVYPLAGYPATAAFTGNMSIGWTPTFVGENPPTPECINYAGSCGPPRRGAQFLVGFDRPINQYLEWMNGLEDADATFDASIVEGDHCAAGDCELRGTGPTPLGASLQATRDFLAPVITCDTASACRSYTTILLTDGVESCGENPVAAAAAMLAGVSGKSVRTYVIGFSVLASEQTQLNQIAAAGGTGSAFFASTKDGLANALATIIAQNQKFELCNDLDDDCDTLVDEDFPEKGLPCTDGLLGVCKGTGFYECTADGSGTTCVISMSGTPSMEICNGLDDDCDGMIDEDDMGNPLPCPTCVSTPEICDGLDNDCDSAVDEQAEVAVNQPAVYGVACGSLTTPNDQPPCKLGTVLCINAGPVCVGFQGPKPETCNGVDDDCDGVGDDMAPCPGATQCLMGTCTLPCGSGEFPCPSGFQCVDGFCFQHVCDGPEDCGADETCTNGVCVPSGMTASSSASTSASTSASMGTAMATTSTGASGGGAGGAGGAGNNGNYGLATGGGGCSTATGGTRDLGALAVVFAVGALGLSARRRRGASHSVAVREEAR